MKEPITLRATLIVTGVNRKSKSPALDDIKRWDVLHLTSVVEPVGRSSRGTHAAYIKVRNGRTGKISYVSYNSSSSFFDAIEYEEVTRYDYIRGV